MVSKENENRLPFLSMVLLGLLIFGGMVTVSVVFWVWPGSTSRQIIIVLFLVLINVFIFIRDKLLAISIIFIFFSQFNISLHSFNMAQPVLFQIYLVDIIICLLMMVVLENRFLRKPDLPAWLILIFLFWCGITTLTSVHIDKSIIYNLWLLKYLFIYMFFRYLPKNEKFIRFFYITCATIILVQSLLAFAQYFHGGALGLRIIGELPDKANSSINNYVRVVGTFGANGFAGYISMLLVVVICGALTIRSKLLYVIGAIGIVSLLISFSRAGWLSFTIGSLILFVQLIRKRYISIPRIIAILIAGILFSGVLFSVFQERIIERLTGRKDISAVYSRLHVYQQGLETAAKHPLLGIGPGLTEFYGAWNENDIFLRKSLPDVKMGNQVHNGFLQVLIETGILGFVIWIGIAAICIKGILFANKSAQPSRITDGFYLATSTAAVVFLVHICFGTEMNNYRLFLLFCVFWGLSRNTNFATGNDIG